MEYYLLAMERYQGDSSLDLAALNNLGNAYMELDRYREAMDSFTAAREIAGEMGSPMLEARILNNIGSLHVRFEQYDSAIETIDEALALGSGSESSEWSRFLWGVRAQALLGQGELADARDQIERTFNGVELSGSTQHFTEFHNAAAQIYLRLEDSAAATPHLIAFKRLDDERRDVATATNLALLDAQFDFAAQELQIEQLRSQGLEQALELSSARSRQKLTIGGGTLVLSLLLLAGVFWRQRVGRERQKMLERALYEDVETGLPSRHALERAIRRTSRTTGRPVHLIALGLDRFKHLENALGFVKTAELKTAIVDRLKSNGEPPIAGLISPEVIGVLPRSLNYEDAETEAQGMRALLSRPIQLEGVDIDIVVTAGLATGSRSDAVVRNAMIALEQARSKDVGCLRFDPEAFGDPARNLGLMSRMLSATETGDLRLNYQPKLHLPSGEVRSVEALSRWHDREEGLISPDRFIPLAEETGHIRPFTEWALAQAVRDQRKFAATGHPVQIAVNISAALLSDTDFVQNALEIVAPAKGAISFELTETAVMNKPEEGIATMRRWREAGVKLALDDYGAGLSSLGYLKTMPCDELKLDRSLVVDAAVSQRDRLLIQSTADLAHGLGLEMTAEGVEDEAALAVLKLMECDWAQGYAIARPLEADALICFLNEFGTDKPDAQAETA